MFVASLSNIKMDCLGIRFYWLFICDRGPQSKSINQSAVAGSKFATNENIFCSFSVVFTHIEKMAMCHPQHTPKIIIMDHLWTSFVPFGLFQLFSSKALWPYKAFCCFCLNCILVDLFKDTPLD